MPKLFVYGSLRKGMSQHHHLKDQTFIGLARSVKNFLLEKILSPEDQQSYAIAREDANGDKLNGEIYQIGDDILQMIDEYEEYPALYDRRAFDFITDEGTTIEALMYCGHRR
jgi:gamma-glutamylaminecyclotransferase